MSISSLSKMCWRGEKMNEGFMKNVNMFDSDVKELKSFLDDGKTLESNKEEILRRNIAHMIVAAQMNRDYMSEVEDYISSVE